MELKTQMILTEIIAARQTLESVKGRKMTISGDKDELNAYFDDIKKIAWHLDLAEKLSRETSYADNSNQEGPAD